MDILKVFYDIGISQEVDFVISNMIDKREHLVVERVDKLEDSFLAFSVAEDWEERHMSAYSYYNGNYIQPGGRATLINWAVFVPRDSVDEKRLAPILDKILGPDS